MLTFLVFIAAALIGLLLRQLEIPIPYMLGGILAAFCCKTFYEARFSGSLSLRNAMLGIAGYGIGAHCTSDTIIRMGAELPGVLGASLSTLFVSVCVAIYGPPYVCQSPEQCHGLPAWRLDADDAPYGRIS